MTSRKPHERLKNRVGRKAKTTPNVGWNRRWHGFVKKFRLKAVPEERVGMKVSDVTEG